MTRPHVIAQMSDLKKNRAASSFDDIMAATKGSLKTHHTNTSVATYIVLLSNPTIPLDQVRVDLKAHCVHGLLRYSGSRTRSQFILQTNSTVPVSLVVENRSYTFKVYEEKIRTALATIYNIPFGAEPIIAEWLRNLGNVIELELPDSNADTSNGRGQVKFSHIFFEDVFDVKKTILSLPGRPPVFLRFAQYVLKDQKFFLADAPTRINILMNRSIQFISKKIAKGASSYAEVVKTSPPKKSQLKKPQSNKRSRENQSPISPTGRSPPPKKPLISVLDEAKIPEFRVKIHSPADIFESPPTPLNLKDPCTPLRNIPSKRQNRPVTGRGKPLMS